MTPPPPQPPPEPDIADREQPLPELRYQPESGCAASAERRGDLLAASAPPAGRWLLIESRDAWPRDALTALRWQFPDSEVKNRRSADGIARAGIVAAGAEAIGGVAVAGSQPPATEHPSRGIASRQPARRGPDSSPLQGSLAAEVARLCAAEHRRPVLIRRCGRVDRTAPRRWAMVDSRPGRESIRWGELPTDEHLLDVLAGADPGTPSTEPIYLVCTHGRHDACCAVRGRPAAAALAAAYPDRTWECSHGGGDRFAANLGVLPHSLFYGHVPHSRAVELASRYDAGFVVPDMLRGSGALIPPVQAAQHFARAAGLSLAVDALRPTDVHELAKDRWQVHLNDNGRVVSVGVAAQVVTIDGAMTCASTPPGRVRQFNLIGEVQTD